MEFRHEWNSRISRNDVMTLNHRLETITRPDIYSSTGYYHVHSLIFEDPSAPAGDSETLHREIYRLRYYNHNTHLIRLEKIGYYKGLTAKESCEVTKDFVETILYKSFSDIVRDPMGRTGEDLDPLIQEFYWKLIGNGLKPAYILHHDRRCVHYPYGDVKISIDCNICVDQNVKHFLAADLLNDRIFDDRILLNIKWNNFLPEVIQSALSLNGSKVSAYY